jgi:hypothetical protein
MKLNRKLALIPTPNPDRRRGKDTFFTPDVVHDAILRAAGFSDLLRVPNGWRRTLAATQPVRRIAALDAVPQFGRQL